MNTVEGVPESVGHRFVRADEVAYRICFCPRSRYHENARSISANRAPLNAEASSESARRSSTSRLCTEDIPHAFASSVISIVIAVRKRAICGA